MNSIHDYINVGQSIWSDYLRRSFVKSGELRELVDQGLRGATANPTIFERAIVGSVDYDDELKRLVAQGKPTEEILEALMIDDIAMAADVFLPVHESLKGSDGFVSIEVNPELADDTNGMIDEARRFFYKLNRPNVMIKIPATEAGMPAVKALTAEGINVNITLIFSIAQYRDVMEAYMEGLEELAAKGGELKKVSSVASFFVSRVDTMVDKELEKKGEKSLQGKIAIANAKMAYQEFKKTFRGPRWDHLRSMGARIQRPLWASTSTKNPAYPDTMYVDSLVGSGTVNTMPPETIRAALDHGKIVPNAIERDIDDARTALHRLGELGIDLDEMARKLEEEGIEKFSKSYETLLSSIARKKDKLQRELRHETAALGSYKEVVDSSLSVMNSNRILRRIWSHDYTVWRPDPTEISNRLGWLHAADIMYENLHRFDEFLEQVRTEGFNQVLLLGMGGSSRAADVFAKAFGNKDSPLRLSILDSTDPDAVTHALGRLDLKKALFLVSSKSGTTVETEAFMRFFYSWLVKTVGAEDARRHFAVITDPGTELASLAEKKRFLARFLNDPNIGGRYSALSYFGLVPAALVGVDLSKLLEQAMSSGCATEPCVDARESPSCWLGAILGELAKRGRDKVTFVTSPRLSSFGGWVEQLIAESTGKEGKGIVPIVGEPLSYPYVYADDRLFISLHLEGDEGNGETAAALSALKDAGHPLVQMELHDLYELGRQFFLWEMAVAVACQVIGVDPFDQPQVESAKVLAQKLVSQYKSNGRLSIPEPTLATEWINAYGNVPGETPGEMLNTFLASNAQPHSYVAVQAFVQPTEETDRSLLDFRKKMLTRFRLATIVGYGPSFLHSTGQLFKGDAGRGLFVQIISENLQILPIPDSLDSAESTVTFGVLKEAQAFGERQALLDAGRRVITFRVRGDVPEALDRLAGALHDIPVPAR